MVATLNKKDVLGTLSILIVLINIVFFLNNLRANCKFNSRYKRVYDIFRTWSHFCHRICFIKSLFKWTHDEGYILKNPVAKLKELKLGQRIPKILSKHEIEHLHEGCHTLMKNALFEFFYSTGCRIGEVERLFWLT